MTFERLPTMSVMMQASSPTALSYRVAEIDGTERAVPLGHQPRKSIYEVADEAE